MGTAQLLNISHIWADVPASDWGDGRSSVRGTDTAPGLLPVSGKLHPGDYPEIHSSLEPPSLAEGL